MMQETSLRRQRVTVWYAIMHDRVVGPYFFENEESVTETVREKRYRNMLNTFLALVVEQWIIVLYSDFNKI